MGSSSPAPSPELCLAPGGRPSLGQGECSQVNCSYHSTWSVQAGEMPHEQHHWSKNISLLVGNVSMEHIWNGKC